MIKFIKNLIIALLVISTVCFGGDIMAEHVVSGIFLDVSNTVQKEFNKIISLNDICFESKTSYLGKTLYSYSIISLPRIELSILVDDYSCKVIDYYLKYKNTSGYEDVCIPITITRS